MRSRRAPVRLPKRLDDCMAQGMPELLVKDPSVVIEVLRRQGAQCGAGITPRELQTCPQDRLCILQDGELCVYGARELGLMSELTREDVCGAVPELRAAMFPVLGIGLTVAAVLGFAFVT